MRPRSSPKPTPGAHHNSYHRVTPPAVDRVHPHAPARHQRRR
jgi:hypothetical protein